MSSGLLEKVPDVSSLSCNSLDFPAGLVIKNLPVKAGDTGSIPGPGRHHMPQGNQACVPQQLCPQSTEAHRP